MCSSRWGMGPAQVNGYYDPQQNRIGMWEFPVRAFYSWYHFPRSFKIKMSNMIYLIRLYLIIMKTKTKNINKQKKEEKRFN